VKQKRKAINFWTVRVKPYLKNSNKYRNKIIKKEIEMFGDDRNKKYYRQKMKIARRVVEKIRVIPWIVMIGITGSVATEWPKKDDDIDFIVICQNNRLWLCRLIVLVNLKFFGFKVRSFFRNKKNGLCFNLWLEEKSMEIEKSRRGMLTALEILWMKPIFLRKNFYNKFLAANKWVKKYIKMNIEDGLTDKKRAKNNLLSWLNLFLYRLQFLYMKNKITREVVTEDKAYFHPRGRIRFDRI